MPYLLLLNINLILMVSSVGFVVAGNNEVGSIVLAARNGWTEKGTADMNNTIISSCAIVGLIVGSLASGKMV